MYNQVISGTTTRFAYDGMKLSTEYSSAGGTTIAARHVRQVAEWLGSCY